MIDESSLARCIELIYEQLNRIEERLTTLAESVMEFELYELADEEDEDA